jgi:hypothetical protein
MIPARAVPSRSKTREAAQPRPGEKQRRCDDRAQRRLHHQRDIVDGLSLLTHRGDFGVT